MGENSKIEWTTHTFSPWWGCTKVGPGCDHCYAETFDRRVGGDHWGTGKARRLIKDWSKPHKWDREAALRGKAVWVFCASMADVFDNEVPPEWRERLWQLVRECRNLNWQFVTKRIGNVANMLPADWLENFGHCGLIATVVNQDEADRDVPKLLRTPAAWRGLSMEPLLGPVSFRWAKWDDWKDASGAARPRVNEHDGLRKLDWVIVGGESGPHARPMHPDWARALRDQCAAAGVAFFFKQWGEWLPGQNEVYKPDWPSPPSSGGAPREVAHWQDGGWGPRDTRAPANNYVMWDEAGAIHRGDRRFADGYFRVAAWASRVGKACAGRLLDGREHNDMPAAARALVKEGETR